MAPGYCAEPPVSPSAAQPLALRSDLGAWVCSGWVDSEAGRTRAGKTARPGVGWRRLQGDAHLNWQDCRCEGARATPSPQRLRGPEGETGVVRGGAEFWGACLWEQAIRQDLTVRARKEKNRALSDLVREIKQVSRMGEHPYTVGFVGANIDTSNPADSAIVHEYMDGGCLQDFLNAQSKNGIPWRPPKATSYSWYAPDPCSRSTLEAE
jgi:hypothetical protein